MKQNDELKIKAEAPVAEEPKPGETLPEGALEGVAGGGADDGKSYTSPWSAPLMRP